MEGCLGFYPIAGKSKSECYQQLDEYSWTNPALGGRIPILIALPLGTLRQTHPNFLSIEPAC